MKKIVVLMCLVLAFSGCEKPLLPTPKTEVENIRSRISIEEISNQTGIKDQDLKNLMDIKPETSVTSLFTGSILARGAEPFWSFSASGSNLTWLAPGVSVVETTLFSPTLTQSGSDIIVIASGLSAVLSPATCSDGMSDISSYTHSVEVTKGVTNYNGCAILE